VYRLSDISRITTPTAAGLRAGADRSTEARAGAMVSFMVTMSSPGHANRDPARTLQPDG
jgi:hypothetical protein